MCVAHDPGSAVATSYAATTALVGVLAEWQSDIRRSSDSLRCQPHPEGVMPSSEVQKRTEALRRLRWTMMPRETIKQRFLWPALRRHLDDGQERVDELRQLKREAEEEMIRLRWADERSLRFDHQIEVLIDELGAFVRCEAELLPRLATAIPMAEQEQILRALTGRHRLLPVQPHPDLPASPWAAVVIGPIAAVFDRLRDRFTTAPG